MELALNELSTKIQLEICKIMEREGWQNTEIKPDGPQRYVLKVKDGKQVLATLSLSLISGDFLVKTQAGFSLGTIHPG